ncbi:hypothetical protein X291_01570 [Oenococcus oeni IOEB_C23]|nr:hypothetical protein X291_01570 [Oenococcus oeni IOEB_C23]
MSNEEIQQVYDYFHQFYLSKVKETGVDQDNLNIFSWINPDLDLTIFSVKDKILGKEKTIYLSPNEQKLGTLIFLDFTSINDYGLLTSNSDEEKIKWLRNKERIKDTNIIPITTLGLSSEGIDGLKKAIENAIDFFVEEEFRKAIKQLSITPLDDDIFDKNLFFLNKFQLADITSGVNDPEFTEEIEEVLFAYDAGKWFLSACALGTTLEHLLILILKNYDDVKGLGKDAGAATLLNKMRINEHINLDVTQERFIRQLFETRNTVSHYNDGWTGKGQVDLLLNGIRSVYKTHYLPSKKFALKNK